MREILFRGKRLDNGEWANGYFADMGNKVCIIKPYEPYWDENCKMFRCRPSDIIPVDFSSVGQLTEEKEFTSDEDGNVTYGEKIFDGDIIRIESAEDGNGEFLVGWDYEKGGWQFKHLRGISGTDCPDAIKIIGNRYDNPELLAE